MPDRPQLCFNEQVCSFCLDVVVEPLAEVCDRVGLSGDIDPYDGHQFTAIEALNPISFFEPRPGAGHKPL